jgi:hypothetical protein
MLAAIILIVSAVLAGCVLVAPHLMDHEACKAEEGDGE